MERQRIETDVTTDIAAESEGSTFDPKRAVMSKIEVFKPFYVKSFCSLQEALKNGKLRDDTAVLVMEHKGGTVVLVNEQMAYHHVAQGEIFGQPWMVSF